MPLGTVHTSQARTIEERLSVNSRVDVQGWSLFIFLGAP